MSKNILIYGFNTRTARVSRRYPSLTFARVLKTAYEAMGHTVRVGLPEGGLSKENLMKYDKVFVGMGSPTALASDKAYMALYTIGSVRGTGKLVLFLDDPEVRKPIYGLGNWVRNPHAKDIFRKAYAKRRLWHDWSLYPEDADRWAAWHVEQCRFLLGLPTMDEYPSVLMPVYDWADTEFLANPLPERAREKVVSVDPSAMVTVHNTEGEDPRDPIWVTDEITRSRKTHLWLTLQHTTNPIVSVDLFTSDAERVQAYRKVWGVLEEPPNRWAAGWWTPIASYATSTGALYLSDPTHWKRVGDAFDWLPSAAEQLNYSERDQLAAEQRNAFLGAIASKSKIKSTLEKVLLDG